MKVALAQVNTTVGDTSGNAAKIAAFAERAAKDGARLAIFPELCLPGYPPLDLLERPSFISSCEREEEALVKRLPEDLIVVFGNISRRAPGAPGPRLSNAAVVAVRGEVKHRFAKTLLPTYDVFDESRYFAENEDPSRNLVAVDGVLVGVTICEDIWNDALFWTTDMARDKGGSAPVVYAKDPVDAVVHGGASIVLNLSASPFAAGKQSLRKRLLAHAARRHRAAICYSNLVGANDGLLFDGNSLAYGSDGAVLAEGARWQEDLQVFETGSSPTGPGPGPEFAPTGCGVRRDEEADPDDVTRSLRDGLVVGIRDYFAKTGIRLAVVGLSGGIDSAVTAYLAAEAVGPSNLIGLAMPSEYSSAGSVTDAEVLAKNLGIEFHKVPIQSVFETYLETLTPVFAGYRRDVTEENLQSRIRGAILMAVANKRSGVVLSTGNKSESAMGYCTLYGDTVGALSVLGDLYKHQVYAIARLANLEQTVIPESSITKPPSAELAPNQKDEDTLPPYPVLDRVLELFIEERSSAEEIAARADVPVEVVKGIVQRVYANEFKRRQLPPTLRVSRRSWTGRRYPVVQKFTE